MPDSRPHFAGWRRILLLTFWAMAPLGAGPQGMLAAPPEDVVVIYNRREHGSEDIARHYARVRGVPESQVFGMRLPVAEQISREEFLAEVQMPIANLLEERQLWSLGDVDVAVTNGVPGGTQRRVVQSKIRYLVLCRGVPLKIAPDGQRLESSPDDLRPEMRRNEASVDSELACLPLTPAGYSLAGPLRNPIYGVTNAALIHPTNGVLMVCRLDAPSAEVAGRLVDKAVQAERDGFWGRAYFDLRNPTEPGMKLGDDWIRAAAEICKVLGFETVVNEQQSTFPAGFPMSQIGIYAGWYRENVDGPFLRRDVEFMPGALAYHLHSFSAASLRTPDRNWVGPLIERGATLSMGCVYEPYLAGTPDIGLLVSRLYYLGFDYGEAAYACQPVVSWMTTVVGDPLFRPFIQDAQSLHQDLVARQDPLRVWSQLRIVNLNLARGFPKQQAATYLEEIPATKESAVLMEKLADLYSDLGKPASALRSWQAALELDPSPQQRIRLELKLGEKLTEAGESSQALETYQGFVEEHPDYPDLVTVYRKLVPLAQGLGLTNQVARFQEQIRRLGEPRS